jgi:hypothetical protein
MGTGYTEHCWPSASEFFIIIIFTFKKSTKTVTSTTLSFFTEQSFNHKLFTVLIERTFQDEARVRYYISSIRF